MVDFEQIRTRVLALTADIKYADEILAQKAQYETSLWSIQEQKKMDCFKDTEFQEALMQQEKLILKNIENSNTMLQKVREKLLRGLGKLS